MKFKLAVIAMSALPLAACQTTERTSQLTSASSGTVRTAGPGDTVMDFRATRALPNAFGSADIFGRRIDAGRTHVRYLGNRGGLAVFERSDIALESNATSMNQTPIFVPTVTNERVTGMVGSTPVVASGSSTTYSMIGPRPTTTYATSSRPIEITLSAGQSATVEGRTLQVVRVGAGTVEYLVR